MPYKKKADLISAGKNAIIEQAYLQEQIEMLKRREILSQHKYDIYQAYDGRWCTYLPQKDGGRKSIKKKNKIDVENAVVEHYRQQAEGVKFSFVYNEWRKYQDEMVSVNTVSKYDSDKKRYFDGKAFFETNIETITEDDIKVFIKTSVEKLDLCQSACKTLYHYIDNTFEFGRRHKYTTANPTEFLHAKDFYCYCNKNLNEKQRVINDNNLDILFDRFKKDHEEHPEYIPTYAVEFASLTGMRVGEIAALRWDSIHDDYILVDKSQKYNTKKKEYYISSTKNEKSRKFPLTDEIKKMLNTVKDIEQSNGYLTDFIFSNEDGPINFRTISSCLKNKCRQVGMKTIGIHAYRRTVNSKMADDGVSVTVRAALLGHSKEVNERYYTYDISTLTDKINVVSNINRRMCPKH